MKKQSLAIISIIALGSVLSSMAYAATISDTTSILNNLTITGTCTGCTTEASFTSYSVILNSTIGGTSGSGLSNLQIGTNGTVFVEALNGEVNVIFKDGTVHKSWVTINAPSYPKSLVQSVTGKYQVGEDDFTAGQPSIHILKNNNELQQLFITKTNWSGSNLSTVGLAISSDGKYIAIYGEDSGLASQRLVILQGS